MPSASASRTSTGNRISAPKLVTSLQRAGAQVERLTLRAHQAGVEERQRVATDLHAVAGSLEAGDDVVGIDGLRLPPADARPHAQQAVGRVRPELRRCAGCRSGTRRSIGTSRAIEKTLKPVNTSLAGGRRAPGMPPRSSLLQVDQVEDPLLIELVGIVELAGDDPPAVRQSVDVGVDERLIVETHFAAGGIAGVVALERTETVDEPIGLRAVVVRQHRQILAQDDALRRRHRGSIVSSPTRMRVTFMVSVPPVSCQSSSLPPPSGSVGLGAASGFSRVRELDAIDHLVLEARALCRCGTRSDSRCRHASPGCPDPARAAG